MSAFIKEASVQAVLAAANIVDVVSGYTSLRKRGTTYVGLCPFHQEKTPSFTVSADRGLYYCFGCGEGGDVVTFLEHMENLSFAEAVEQLAQRFGVTLEYEEGATRDVGRKDREARLLTLLDKAATFYERHLWETEKGRTAREYLKRRGLSEEVCRAFRVGFSPDEWRGLFSRAAKQGFTDRELEEAGLVVRQGGRVYDRFRGRLMFPLVDHRGRVLGFGGRTLTDETPKYVNSPEGPVYRKGQLLYGLYQARKAIAQADEVVVVEGYTDVLALVQAGMENVVASMGTALTEAQIGLMMRFTRNVTFMFDADRAGTEAMLRSGQLARAQSLRPMVMVLPAGRDPADAAVEGGAEALARVKAGKMSLLRFELMQALERGDTSTPEGRVKVFDQVRRIMAQVESPKEREEEIPLVADRLRLSNESVALLLRGGRARSAARGGGARPAGPLPLAQRLLASETTIEREFLVAAACNSAQACEILEALTPEHFNDPSNREVFVGLREALLKARSLGEESSAVEELKWRARSGSQAGALFVRLVMEADQGRYSTAVLEELHLRLQEQYLKREIAALREALDQAGDNSRVQRRLVNLERLLQSVRAGLLNLDPEEGRS